MITGEFVPWGSTPRLFKKMDVTEKIDGTNACLVIQQGMVTAQSRKRTITPDNDNYGFARWAYDNAGALMDTLGYGYHYGEWYGEGIQKNPLRVEGRYFALFRPWRYQDVELDRVDGLTEVPWLHNEAVDGPADHNTISRCLEMLREGSKAAGAMTHRLAHKLDNGAWKDPEGLIVWTADRNKYKVLLHDDSYHKWEVEQRNSRPALIRGEGGNGISHGGLNLGQVA